MPPVLLTGAEVVLITENKHPSLLGKWEGLLVFG